MTTTTSTGQGPGTIAGPAVKFTLTFSQQVNFSNVVTNLAFGSSQAPGSQETDPAPVVSGNSITYIFDIQPSTPANQRTSVTISVQLTPNLVVNYSSAVS